VGLPQAFSLSRAKGVTEDFGQGHDRLETGIGPVEYLDPFVPGFCQENLPDLLFDLLNSFGRYPAGTDPACSWCCRVGKKLWLQTAETDILAILCFEVIIE